MLYNNGTHAPSLGANGSGQDAASVLVLGTQEYLRGHGYSNATARAITGWTAPIYDGEYRIAFRYSIDPYNIISAGSYHFIYELSTGQWAGKYANQQSYNHGFINPDLDEVGQWSYGAISSALTYYMAVKLT